MLFSLVMRLERLFHDGMNQAADIAPETGNLSNHAGGEVGVLLCGHQMDGFDLIVQFAVDARQLKFVLKIGHGTQTSQDDAGVNLSGLFDQKIVETDDGDIMDILCNGLEQGLSLWQRKQGLFCGIGRHGNNDMIEESASTMNQVGMAVGDGVKGARIDCNQFRHEQDITFE